MNVQKHLTIWLVTFVAWLGFYLLGILSNYYTEWSHAALVLLSLVGFFAVVPLIGCVVLICLGGDHVRTSFWFAFYASIPLFIYDFVLVGIIGGEGFRYLVSHWYLTIAYVYVWIELPIIGLALKKLKADVVGVGGSYAPQT
ncbi:MAG: hypothetical protein GY832_21105 [Chloroflexi bacterium]|nr:hypothetical protein [Chloroflexota bacterium]